MKNTYLDSFNVKKLATHSLLDSNNLIATEVISCFLRLKKALDTLCAHVATDLNDLPVNIDNGAGEFTIDRQGAIDALKNFDLNPIFSPTETFSCPGLIAGTQETILLIDEVNLRKDEFKKSIKIYKDQFINDKVFTNEIRHLLSQIGESSIKLKQVYRHIKYISFHPNRVAWLKTRGSSNKVITKSDAMRLLNLAGKGGHIAVQLVKLQMLGHNERLVIQRKIKPYWQINVCLKENECTKNFKIRASLPLFYIHSKYKEIPKIQYCKSGSKQIKTRSDKILEDSPWLQSISAYRYVNEKNKNLK